MKISYLSILVLLTVLLLVANITLLALNKISEILFWIIIIVAAIFAYKVLPKMKKYSF